MTNIKLGVVGCGWAGRQAVLAASAVPRTTVVAISDLNPARHEGIAEEFSVEAYSDYRELLAVPEVEAVYLATNPDVRLQMVLDTLNAGKHALVQKPHAIRASEILEMEAAAKGTGRNCSRMNHSHSPTIVELYGSTGAVTGGAISRFKDSAFIREEIDEPVDIAHSAPPENPPVFFYEIEHFAMAVAGEVEPDVSATDAYTFMKILDVLYDSAKEQRKIVIE